MAKNRGILRPGDLPLRRTDFQFSIKRLLIAMTAVAVLMAVARPSGVSAPGVFAAAFFIFVFLVYDWSWLRVRRAHQMMQNRRFSDAAAAYTRTIADQPDAVDRYCFRAAAYEWLSDFDAAAADYTEAIRRESRYLPAWVGRARAEFHRSNYQKAIDDASIALCLSPVDVTAMTLRGLAYTQLGDYATALEDLDVAVAAAPGAWDVLQSRAFTHHWAENWQASIDDLSAIPGAWENSESAGMMLATARFKVGEHAIAFEIIEAVLGRNPKSSEALSFQALFLATCPDAKLRDGRRAVEIAERARQLAVKEDLVCMAALAAAYAETGQFERAVEFGRKAVEAAPLPLRARHESRLSGYEAQQPYRDWPKPS